MILEVHFKGWIPRTARKEKATIIFIHINSVPSERNLG